MKAALLASAALLALCGAAAAQTAPEAVLATYADIAHAGYEDALKTAEALDAAIEALIASPSEATLLAARAAWVAARAPYMQTEVYRFGNPVVDAWEGRVNAWPLDEGLIDYVAGPYGAESDTNALYTVNVIANPIIAVNGAEVDASTLTPQFLAETLHDAEGVETNVATGYHAIEFLLWGQDLNGTAAGAGNRPATDYDEVRCTGGNCERRAAYLSAASDLLVADLGEMVRAWAPGGAAREAVTADPKAGLAAILTGIGSLSYGELAGERMKLGLLLHDPEEEHDCFADTTAAAHYHDTIGMRNVYTGHYRRIDGTVVAGPSLADLVAEIAPDLNEELLTRLDASVAATALMKTRAESVEAYDQMIGEGNAEGNAVVQAAIDTLVAQTPAIERVVAALDLGAIAIEGSDSLDNVSAVFE